MKQYRRILDVFIQKTLLRIDVLTKKIHDPITSVYNDFQRHKN